MTERIYPLSEWEYISPTKAGFVPERLKKAKLWLDENVDGKRYRVIIVRNGKIVAEWNHNISRDARLHLALVYIKNKMKMTPDYYVWSSMRA